MPVGPLEGSLDKTQPIERREDEAKGRSRGNSDVDAIGAEKHKELADEVTEPWKPDRGHRKGHSCPAEYGHGLPEAAHLVDLARVHALLEHASDHEQCAGAEAVA